MCVGCAKLIFSVSFQFYLMAPEEGRVWGQLMAPEEGRVWGQLPFG